MSMRSCSDLKSGEAVVALVYNSIYEKKIPIDGTVVFVNADIKKVDFTYLYGYRQEYAFVPFEDMLAVSNPNGEFMKFGNISGKSDLLLPE